VGSRVRNRLGDANGEKRKEREGETNPKSLFLGGDTGGLETQTSPLRMFKESFSFNTLTTGAQGDLPISRGGETW